MATSSAVSALGLLVKMLDGMEDDPTEPWHACRPPAWCSEVDHVSLSLINRQLPHVYTNPDAGLPDVGLVLHDNLRIECAMVVDGGTLMRVHGGCDRCTCGEPDCSTSTWCVYRPHQLGAFLSAHLTETCISGRPCREIHNEVVVLKSDYEARLPHAIRAFFCVRSQECAEARAMRDHFVSAYLPKHRRIADELPVLRYLGGEDGFVDARDRESESRHV